MSYGHFRQCVMQINSRADYRARMAGYAFYLSWRGTRGIGGVLFYNGRGIGGILAGYLNYWRRNLPLYEIQAKCMYVLYISISPIDKPQISIANLQVAPTIF